MFFFLHLVETISCELPCSGFTLLFQHHSSFRFLFLFCFSSSSFISLRSYICTCNLQMPCNSKSYSSLKGIGGTSILLIELLLILYPGERCHASRYSSLRSGSMCVWTLLFLPLFFKKSPSCVFPACCARLSIFLAEGEKVARTAVVKYINEYIGTHKLQNPAKKSEIEFDQALNSLFNPDPSFGPVTYFNLWKLMGPHFLTKKKPSSLHPPAEGSPLPARQPLMPTQGVA